MTKSWSDLKFWSSEEWKKIQAFLDGQEEYFPNHENVFSSLIMTPLNSVKVVILGQDPYHRRGQADGLAFSMPNPFINLPPSLQNIFIELRRDIGGVLRQDGDLSDWAEQGVLLLNKHLTVKPHTPLSHRHLGWDVLTNEILFTVKEVNPNAIFVLWGKEAQEILPKLGKVNTVLGSHPSPLSASRGGFFNKRPFSQINIFLRTQSKKEIVWTRPRFQAQGT